MSTALRTDRYELTMLDAALRSGVAGRRAVFEVFARSLPPGRRYGVVAGLGRLLEALEEFRFGAEELAWLERERVVSEQALDWLGSYRLSATVDAYGEGECYFADSPVLTVDATLGEGLLLETLVLSVLNADSAVASAAARMVVAARGRDLVEMGSRRVHDAAAPAVARAAYLAGFSSTSNLEAGRRFGVPTAGTASHAFTLAYPSERDAFDAQLASSGPATTLLVDTFDVESGVEHAVDAARRAGASGPGAVRIDSGDLASLALSARRQLDRLGASATRIVVSSDLDEHVLESLGGAPVDAYGVGTSVATGAGAPTAGFVYKLVAVAPSGAPGAELHPVAKRSVGKAGLGGRKLAYRVLDASGTARGELLALVGRDLDGPLRAAAVRVAGKGASLRPLQRSVLLAGEPVGRETLDAARARARTSILELDPVALDVRPGDPAMLVEHVQAAGPGPSG
ncbi:MAG: nicotinate phosphoribosyltransferase [Actinomycetota bacterium]|nr:nicotinate phosphoribosyltransferase [Actinomycetota bacterium]